MPFCVFATYVSTGALEAAILQSEVLADAHSPPHTSDLAMSSMPRSSDVRAH